MINDLNVQSPMLNIQWDNLSEFTDPWFADCPPTTTTMVGKGGNNGETVKHTAGNTLSSLTPYFLIAPTTYPSH